MGTVLDFINGRIQVKNKKVTNMVKDRGILKAEDYKAERYYGLCLFGWISKSKFITLCTTRKLINTNGNIEGIFPLVNFWEILPTEIFPRYIPRELPWEKKLKQSKKNDDVSFSPTDLPTEQIPSVIPSVNLLVNCEHCSSC